MNIGPNQLCFVATSPLKNQLLSPTQLVRLPLTANPKKSPSSASNSPLLSPTYPQNSSHATLNSQGAGTPQMQTQISGVTGQTSQISNVVGESVSHAQVLKLQSPVSQTVLSISQPSGRIMSMNNIVRLDFVSSSPPKISGTPIQGVVLNGTNASQSLQIRSLNSSDSIMNPVSVLPQTVAPAPIQLTTPSSPLKTVVTPKHIADQHVALNALNALKTKSHESISPLKSTPSNAPLPSTLAVKPPISSNLLTIMQPRIPVPLASPAPTPKIIPSVNNSPTTAVDFVIDKSSPATVASSASAANFVKVQVNSPAPIVSASSATPVALSNASEAISQKQLVLDPKIIEKLKEQGQILMTPTGQLVIIPNSPRSQQQMSSSS